MKFLNSIFALFLLPMSLFAQEIKGTVKEQKAQGTEAVFSATVVILDAQMKVLKGTRTDFDGLYQMQIPAGTYKLRFSATGLKEQVQDLVIGAGETKEIDIILESPVQDQKEVIVVGKLSRTSDKMLVDEIKEDDGVKTSVNAEQIAQNGSSDTKEVLSKMSGVSAAQSSGTIFVRGLGDRYNTAFLNGLPLVSSSPELRVMPMDIIPTSIIEVLDVSKMLAPNLYGDFAGGAINIRTKKVYKNPVFKFSLGSSFNTIVTGKEFNSYQGGKFDFFGYDDGTRAIPDGVVTTSLNRADNIYKNGLYYSQESVNGNDFSQNFNVIRKKALPGSNFRFEGGNYFKSKKENSDFGFGFLTMVSHSSGYSIKNGTSRYFNAQNKLEYNFDRKDESFNVSSVGLASFLVDLNKKNQLNLNYLYINNVSDQTSQSWGYHRDYSDGGYELYGRRNTFDQNNIQVVQLLGKHELDKQSKLQANWGTSYSLTRNLIPDRKQISALTKDREDTEHYSLLALDANHTHRFFSVLRETELAAHGDLNYQVYDVKSGDSSLRSLNLILGVDYKQKNRDFSFRQFNYLAKPLADKFQDNFDIMNPDQYLNNENHRSDLYRIEESANPGNGYQAGQSIIGSNLGAKWNINQKLELIPNLRAELGDQIVSNRKQTQANIKEVNIINGLDLMPSLSMKYETVKNHQLRFGASRTIIRPKFFEVAPFQYLAQVIGLVQVGNSQLQNASNLNLDLRYEIYADRSADYLVIGTFGKKLINPIEQVQLPSASGQIISFDNTKGGILGGAEVEFVKSLAFLGKDKKSSWRNWSLVGNLAYTYSRIDVGDETGFTTNAVHPLQGASPLLANLMLRYKKQFVKTIGEEEENGLKISGAMSLSYTSKTLFALGIQGIGDQYLFPTYRLNYTQNFQFNEQFTLSLVLRNLLNTNIGLYQQDMVNVGEWQLVNTYKTGIDFQFKLTYAFKGKQK